ncbi:MAG: C_GCAxxG_C_C family protein [Thermoplasmatales archaeon]|nr:MAG: C_GCAxxG_C_C family protein [Thermoplasmatales archaeon]
MESKEELLNKAYNLAFKYEAELGSCPQCVLAAIKETLDVGSEDIFKSADALAGGTSLSSKGTCGALVGGMLAISSIVGREYNDFKAGKKKRLVFKYAKILYDRFVKEYGSPLCCDVQKRIFGRSFNLWDPIDYKEFEKAGAHVDKCPRVSGNAARWTAEIILNEMKP